MFVLFFIIKKIVQITANKNAVLSVQTKIYFYSMPILFVILFIVESRFPKPGFSNVDQS